MTQPKLPQTLGELSTSRRREIEALAPSLSYPGIAPSSRDRGLSAGKVLAKAEAIRQLCC